MATHCHLDTGSKKRGNDHDETGKLIMATITKIDPNLEDKGKMIVAVVAGFKSTDSNKKIRVIVYSKWISKHNQTRQPTIFCCMLIDKQIYEMCKKRNKEKRDAAEGG